MTRVSLDVEKIQAAVNGEESIEAMREGKDMIDKVLEEGTESNVNSRKNPRSQRPQSW